MHNNINKDEDYSTYMKELEDNDFSLQSNSSHTNEYSCNQNKLFLFPINDSFKRKRYRNFNQNPNHNNIDINQVKMNTSIKHRHIIPINNIEQILSIERLELVNTPIKSRLYKIFSNGNSLFQNLYKNYYPCNIPDHYAMQITNKITHNEIRKITKNMSSFRAIQLENKRKMLNHIDHSILKEKIVIYKGKSYAKDKDDYTKNDQYWMNYFHNNNNDDIGYLTEDENEVDE